MGGVITSFKRFSVAMMIVTLMLGSMNAAWAGDDHDAARQLLEAGEILSLENILADIRPSYPGRILEVDLEREHGRMVYELEILGPDSVVREIYVDAHSGEILSVEEDD